MLATILALKAWAVYRIAKMVSSFVRMARLVSLRRLVLVIRFWYVAGSKKPA